MKTIKLTLLGLLFLFITVLFIKYAVVSYNHITTDFTTTGTTESFNFGLTFTIQTIVLVALAMLSTFISINCFTLAHKYYIKWTIARDNYMLRKHITTAKYNKVCDEVSKTNIIEKKEELVNDYLGIDKTDSFQGILKAILRDREKAHIDNIRESLQPDKIVKERDTYTKYTDNASVGEDIKDNTKY